MTDSAAQKITMEHRFDFLVLGSGIAGLSFALKVADRGQVAIVTKMGPEESSTKYAQGGIASVTDFKDDSFDDRHWLWSLESWRANRFAQVHAFDVEIELALLIYVDSGFSPGELVDFLLGLVLIDIAADDDRL